MTVTNQDLDFVRGRDPDTEGSSSKVYFGQQRVLKEVEVSEDVLDKSLELTEGISPRTDYEFFGSVAIVEQPEADEIYEAENWEQLEGFLSSTADIAETAIQRGFALDYKPANFGLYDGETLYIDNQDLGSVREIEEPGLAMSTQLRNHFQNKDNYEGRIPEREEIMNYWDRI